MFTSYAEAAVFGRVVKQPIVQSHDSGGLWVRFSLAVNQDYKDRTGLLHKKSLFMNCVAYGKTAEFIQKFVKEKDRLFVKGDLRSNDYDSKDGHKVKDVQLVVTKFQLVDYKKEQEGSLLQDALKDVENVFKAPQQAPRPSTPTFTVDDIPF